MSDRGSINQDRPILRKSRKEMLSFHIHWSIVKRLFMAITFWMAQRGLRQSGKKL